jgi:uncharacterized membrane protein
MSGFLDDHWNRAKLIWGVFALGTLFSFIHTLWFICLIINVVAFVLAVMWKKEATGDVYSHFSHQIKFFIFFAVGMIVSWPLFFVFGLGLLTAYATSIAFIVVCVIGFLKANEKKPITLLK